MTKSANQLIAEKVRVVGRDQWGRPVWQFGQTGKRYTGKNARQRAIAQGHALMKGVIR